MTMNLKLESLSRNGDENTKEIVKSGFVPAIVYGPHLKANKLVKIKASSLAKAFVAAGESTLIDLSIDGKEEGKVLFKDDQRDILSNSIIHVDLYEVDMKKEIHANIVLNFIGSPAAVETEGGVLVKSIDEIEVKCLPGALVNHIDIDLSVLAHIHDVIKLSDLKLPEGMKLTAENDDVVATVTELKVEKEEPVVAPVAEAAAAATPAQNQPAAGGAKKE
jgi:large subunit ribosomal protein L25